MTLLLAVFMAAAVPLAERVVGTWTAVSYEARYADGRVVPAAS